MSISQLDPSLITLTPSSVQLGRSPSKTLSSGPNLSCLTLASDVSGTSMRQPKDPSASPDARGKKKTRSRRTQKEMAIYRAEQEQMKKLKAQQKRKGKQAKPPGRVRHSARASQAGSQTNREPLILR
ncbi:hypothetical protein PGT21_023159 [Puccinia graminis f. sp. tritici]|uniref:Uncharacterized protein n=1 Tax=Puccinia graminis f. sp. tritici TaxID=56615 RepID=A0A5B0PYA8_PUCGR|nr:hypothetical protein PGT21_023159 [Puccinia graminis f. sp. tritici]